MPVTLVAWEAETVKIEIKASPGKKLHETPHLKGKKLGVIVAGCGGMCLTSQLQQKCKIGGSQSRVDWAKSETLFPK
jgi:hypothetical protein